MTMFTSKNNDLDLYKSISINKKPPPAPQRRGSSKRGSLFNFQAIPINKKVSIDLRKDD